MEESDMDSSIGVNNASDDEELDSSECEVYERHRTENRPHTDKVLHHEFVYSLCWMCHVHLASTVLEIGLRKGQQE